MSRVVFTEQTARMAPIAIALIAFSPAGCFNPDEPSTANDTGSTGLVSDSGETTGPATEDGSGQIPPATDDGPGSTVGPSDSSGAADNPPEVTGFTVNGSTTPPELSVSGTVTLDLDAIDDIGIDRVEFYDGDQLVATTDASPYVAEVLLTSSNNGVHQYSATVFDTAEQSAHAEAVDLSVAIVGGEVAGPPTSLGPISFSAPPMHMSAIGETIEVSLVADSAGPQTTELTHWSFTEGLSQLRRLGYPSSADWSVWGAIPPTPIGDNSLVSSSRSLTGGEYSAQAFRIDLSERSITPIEFGSFPIVDGTQPGILVDSAGALVHTSDGYVVKRASALEDPVWEFPLTVDTGIIHHLTSAGDDILIDYAQSDCLPGHTVCLARLAANGSLMWTVGLESSVGSVRVDSDGTIATLESSPVRLNRYAEDGTVLSPVPIPDDDDFNPNAFVFASDGDVVAVGSAGPFGYAPWAIRIGSEGTVRWSQIYTEFDGDAFFGAVTISGSGRLFVVGIEDIGDPVGLTVPGEGLVAELSL